MHLPERPVCFACKSPRKQLIWNTTSIALVACLACGAEWVEGFVPANQAYSYGDHDNDQIYQRYLKARAVRFAANLKRFSVGDTGRLLDVGCGTGEFLVAAKDISWKPAGIELTEETAALAYERTGFPVMAGDFAKKPLSTITL